VAVAFWQALPIDWPQLTAKEVAVASASIVTGLEGTPAGAV
jgi:hypothetical protein